MGICFYAFLVNPHSNGNNAWSAQGQQWCSSRLNFGVEEILCRAVNLPPAPEPMFGIEIDLSIPGKPELVC